MNKSRIVTVGIVVAVAVALGGYGLYKGVFSGADLIEAGKTTVAGGDPVKALCIKYVKDKDVVIAPADMASDVSQAVPGTRVIAPSSEQNGGSTTTLTPSGPVPLGIPMPEGSASPDERGGG